MKRQIVQINSRKNLLSVEINLALVTSKWYDNALWSKDKFPLCGESRNVKIKITWSFIEWTFYLCLSAIEYKIIFCTLMQIYWKQNIVLII